MQDKRQKYLLGLLLFVFMLSIVGAYLYGERDTSAKASSVSSSKPVKKFRAKEGTERKGARALVSSRPSAPEEKTTRPIDIWGSLERDEPEVREKQVIVKNAIDLGDPVAAIERLKRSLDPGGLKLSPMDLAYTNAALASLYVLSAPPDRALAEEAYAKALEAAEDGASHVLVVNVYAEGLLQSGDFERLVEVTELGSFDVYPLSAELLEIGVLRGIALEQLERPEEAQEAYAQSVDAAIGSGGRLSEKAANVFRQASLRLARLFRAEGMSGEANAVARRLRALLEPQRGAVSR